MERITIDLPFPVSVNRIWRYGRGRVYKSTQYRSWIRNAGMVWISQRPLLEYRHISGPYSLVVVVNPPTKRKVDIDNLIKVLNDFAQRFGIVQNDHLCQKFEMSYGDNESAPLGARLTFSSV